MSNTIPLPDPYGQITTHTLRDQQFFYRWPDPPYLDNAKECICVYTREHMHAHAAAVCAERDARIKVLEDALSKIDAIRNDIIGRQKIGWSSHVYPLVAALDEAGYPGLEYEAARAALGDSAPTPPPPSPSPRS